VIAPIALLGGGALVAFAIRKRVEIVGPVTTALILAAMWWTASSPEESTEVLGLQMRLSPLAQLGSTILLASLLVLVLAVWLDEPAYNFFPTALGAGAAVIAVLTLTTPIAIYAVLLLALLLPVGSFTFQVTRNRSAEAAYRHFSFVALGGAMGIAALALAGSLPREQPPATFVVLVVIVVVAFALKLAAIPFHTHAALLATEVPASALALYFGVLVPTTFIAFAEILTLSGLLPAIVQISKVQDLLLGLGTVSAVGGAFLATGSTELRRVAAYSVIANLGQALVGIATLSGPGIVGAISIALVTGAGATQQLLAAGAIERRSGADRPNATEERPDANPELHRRRVGGRSERCHRRRPQPGHR
jgi:formate hydrogenlyase subunit 3/multisubunit Na+/H+ antiporter MnhD subunit